MVPKIQVIESALVAPSGETPAGQIWLSNLDLLVARAHTPTVYFYRPNGTPQQDFFSPPAMKAALSKALFYFYPMAGRLGSDASGRLCIDCTGEGVLFVVAKSGLAMDDFGDFAPSDELRRLLVPSVESGDPPCILVMVQLTFFECGGVCLGAAVHHTAADGLGSLHFMNTWSDIGRGIPQPTILPFLDRSVLRARSPPSITSDHVEYSPKPSSSSSSSSRRPFSSAILNLSKHQLTTLKTPSNPTAPPLSTFKAVVAHVWRSACKARRLGAASDTRLYMTADARSRLRPPLPPGYLGNAIFRASAVANAGDIIANDLGFGAAKVGTASARLNDPHIRSLIDFLEVQEDVRGMAKGKWVLPETDLWVISWQGLPIYEADFGWGQPEFMGRACLQFAGLVYIMNRPGDDGGVAVAVALEPENMERFKEMFFENLGCA